MKKIKYYIFLLIGVFLLQSCVSEEDDLFGKSGAERLNEAQKYYEKILTGAPNGWILEYVAGDTDANRRGAFNFLLKFENGEVTASVDELAMYDINPISKNPYERKTSLYRFDQDMSVTLSFSSYNSFLHYYHEQHGSYTTYKGDFEFTIMEASEDLVILRGKKYGNIMEMHRLPENITWDGYLAKVNSLIDSCSVYSNFELMYNNEVIGTGTTNSNNRYTFKLTSSSGGNNQGVAPNLSSNVIFTETGIKFIDPLSIDNKEVQRFDWDNVNKMYVCSEGIDVKIVPQQSPTYLYYKDYIGTYSLRYNNNIVKTVTITEKVKNKSLSLKGLSDFEIELVFDKIQGTVSLLTQDVGKVGSNTVVLCPWDTEAGYLIVNTGYGMVNVVNEKKLLNDNIIEFTLVDNGVWSSRKANGFLLRLYNSVLGSHSNTTYVGYYPGNYQFYNFTFTKQ